MAFLCPSRLGRNKQKQGFESLLEKLTDGRGIDTLALEDLVKLSWTTPDSRRIILQNFTACASHELTVKQGQKVNYIYREGDWGYIVADDKKEGFVPFAFLAKIGGKSKPEPRKIDTNTYTKRVADINKVNKPAEINNRKISVESEGTDHSASDVADDSFVSTGWSNDSFTEPESTIAANERPAVNYLQTGTFTKLPMFYEVFLDERTNILHKNPLPPPETFRDSEPVHPLDDIGPPSPSLVFKVVHNFTAKEKYDIPVKVGEVVHLLDDSDPGWFWVCKPDGTEGFVPSNYIAEITEDSFDDTELSSFRESDRLTPDQLEHNHVYYQEATQKVNNSVQKEIPTNWKLTNQLKGKSPVSVNSDEDVLSDRKKQRPKKPPRKKKNQHNELSPSLDDSMDSLDTCLTDTSLDYLDNDRNTSCDELSPRSCIYSESSILDSSYTEVYGQSPLENTFFEELSPRSHTSENTRKLLELDKALDSIIKQDDHDLQTKRQTHNKYGTREVELIENLKTVHHQQQKQNVHGHNKRLTSDSFVSMSSVSQRQKRPLSLPGFKSYQDYKKDYYDEYFYEDRTSNQESRSNADVVNVSEILKLREKNEHRQMQNTLNLNNVNVRESKHNQPKLKPYLLNINSTKPDNRSENGVTSNVVVKGESHRNSKEQTRKRFHSSADVENKVRPQNDKSNLVQAEKLQQRHLPTFQQMHNENRTKKSMKKQYNSSIDLRHTENNGETKTFRKTSSSNHDALKTHSDDKKNKEKQTVSHLRPYNSSTDLRDIRGKPDWSFGYPRKERKSIGREECNRKSEKSKGETNISNGCDKRVSESKEVPQRKERHDIDHSHEGKERRSKGKSSIRNNGQKCHSAKRLGDENIVHTDQEISRHNNEKKVNVDNGDNVLTGRSNGCISVNRESSFNEDAMEALLQQTGDLVYKTDGLLGDKTEKFLNARHKISSANTSETPQRSDSLHSDESSAYEKCNTFLNNSTIGIHGMTYFVTEDRINSVKKMKNIQKTGNHSITVDSIRKESSDHNTRREKSNVMKENSSEVVSDELKFLDLQDIRGITEFVCQCDYEPDTDNMLEFKRGEIMHIGLDGQDSGEWYWGFSPRLRKNGFIPKKYVKIPLVTII